MDRVNLIGLTCGLTMSVAITAGAATPEQSCQGGKNELAGKYALCQAKAEKKLASAGDHAAFSNAIARCADRYSSGWVALESKAVGSGGTCVDDVSADDLRGFVTACVDVVADVAAGGALPLDVITCNTDLATCQAERGEIENQLAICRTDLTQAVLCGNGRIDTNEDCDFGTLGGTTCVEVGFAGGTLSCGAGCVFDTSDCLTERFIDNADGTVTDHDTGLMWEKKVQRDVTMYMGNPHDADNAYSWSGTCTIGGDLCQPNANAEAACLAGMEGDATGCSQCAAGVCDVTKGLGITVWEWLGSLNAVSFGGHSDWRIPTRTELSTVRNAHDTNDPTIDAAFHGPNCGALCADITAAECSCSSSGAHWSATTAVPILDTAFVVQFSPNAAATAVASKAGNGFRVRAVRGGL